MRKKDLLKLNAELFERAENFQLAYEELKQENMRLNARVEELVLENEALKNSQTATEPFKALEERVLSQIKIGEPAEYGAKAIGKIVVSATRNCNDITALNTANSKELINLILGRTEVAKAEILRIIDSESDFELAKELIEQEKSNTEDYFKSVRAQIENI